MISKLNKYNFLTNLNYYDKELFYCIQIIIILIKRKDTTYYYYLLPNPVSAGILLPSRIECPRKN